MTISTEDKPGEGGPAAPRQPSLRRGWRGNGQVPAVCPVTDSDHAGSGLQTTSEEARAPSTHLPSSPLEEEGRSRSHREGQSK